MTRRWRGRSIGHAIIAHAALGTNRSATIGAAEPALVLRGPDGAVLAEVRVPDARFTLRYRNSLYRTLADELYAIRHDGAIVLVGLAAEQLAVLEEYYGIQGPARETRAGPMRWAATPAREVIIQDLVVAATDRGERTLLVPGAQPLVLTALVEDRRPSVTIEVRRP
jgi:hypothetical protein